MYLYILEVGKLVNYYTINVKTFLWSTKFLLFIMSIKVTSKKTVSSR